MIRRRGQRGPSARRQNVTYAAGQRLGVSRDRLSEGMRLLNRDKLVELRVRNRESWPFHAYFYYSYLLRNGLSCGIDGTLRLSGEIPDEILQMPLARRRKLDPYEVATWAFRVRHQGTKWVELEIESEAESIAALKRSSERAREIERRLAELKKEPPTRCVKQEIDYCGAKLEFVRPPLGWSDELPGRTASSMRKAVASNHLIWEIAEKHFAGNPTH